jgi:mono/diheme cytochrome c family protein
MKTIILLSGATLLTVLFLFATSSSQPAGGKSDTPRPSDLARGDQRPSDVARGDQRPTDVARGDQRPTDVARGDRRPTDFARGDQRPSDVARGDRRPTDIARGDQRPTSVGRGEKLFQRNCASCHGLDGRGAGLVAASLKKQPSDLTMIPRKNGKFPTEELLMSISGELSLPIHGSREMPVWGGVLKNGDILSLVRYIESIQRTLPILAK